jgi:site-specific DNA recombinase
VATWRSAREQIEGLTEASVREALERLDPLWDELFPAEQTRIVQLLVERINVDVDGIDVRLRVDGLTSLVGDLADAERSAA